MVLSFQLFSNTQQIHRKMNIILNADLSKSSSGDINRRRFLQSSSCFIAALIAAPHESLGNIVSSPAPSKRPLFWSIDNESPPNMQPYTNQGEKRMLKDIAKNANAVFIGEHHESPQDHELQASIISRLLKDRKELAIGVEMVQQKFQPALDAYISKQIKDIELADKELFETTEWTKHWPWEFESYFPVLHLAREKGISLVALNIDSETMNKVKENGLDGLSPEEKEKLVSDPKGFINAVTNKGFKYYADRVILSSFEDDVKRGVFPATMQGKANFFAARILQDEAIANRMAQYLQDNPKALMVTILGADHVKFGYGSSWRLERLMSSAAAVPLESRTILLNPSAKDSLSLSTTLRLRLGNNGEREEFSKPLANLLIFSSSPRVNLLTHPLNPVS